jgi:hypothetical protein
VKIDFKSQRIAHAIEYVYRHKRPVIGTIHYLYDHLIETGHKIEFSDEEKKVMWKNSGDRLLRQNRFWFKGDFSAEKRKEWQVQYYKTELVFWYLKKMFEKGYKLNITNEDGEEIKPIRFKSF